MKLKYIISTAIFALMAIPAIAKIDVVATSTDLGDIAKAVGGSKVSVTTLMLGTQNPHAVEPRPSQVVKLRNADVVVRIGMDLDMWVDSLIEAARNSKISRGGRGYIDASENIRKLEIPRGRVDGSRGDIHVYGNPHYWLDPENAKVIASTIFVGLKRVSPSDTDYFRKNYEAFADKIDRKMPEWKSRLASCKGEQVVTYHKTWVYFLRRFGLKEFDNVETKPGIPPSPSHISELISSMKREKVKLIMTEPFYPRKYSDMVARATGAKVVEVPASIGGARGINNYFELMDRITSEVAGALR
ncbi:MAG: metal ABC transporter substrate-binding protein [Armatimonadota bacterium]